MKALYDTSSRSGYASVRLSDSACELPVAGQTVGMIGWSRRITPYEVNGARR